MTEEEAVTRLEQAVQERQNAAEAFEAAIVQALRDGLRPKKVAEITEYSYETIRRLARKHGIQRLREPTVTSRKPKPGDDSPA